MNDKKIETLDLSKTYEGSKSPALAKLNIAVLAGEVYGFLGANGAGKTTTIRLLLNLLRPSSGSALIDGVDVAKKPVASHQSIGYLAGDVALYQKCTARQLLDYLSSLQPATKYRATLEKRFEAELDKPINKLSKGNKQKIGIIQAFMHEPDVIILDEPTSGLDPLMQEAFYETARDSRNRGAAILMSSHNLTEAQRICDRIGIIKQGKLIHEQLISDDDTLGTVMFKVTFVSPLKSLKLDHIKGLKLNAEHDHQTATFAPTGSIADALKVLSHFDIKDFSTTTVSLEDEFIESYGGKS